MTGAQAPRKPGLPGAPGPQKKRSRRFEIDRVIAMRVAFVAVVVLFLYMILRVSMIAFGGSASRETKRIERAVDTSTAHPPAAGSAVPGLARPAP